MPIKIAIIGAGSVTFTMKLFRDVLAVPELQDARFALMDINPRYLRMVEALCRKAARENRLPAGISATTERRAALDGAHYVFNCARIGGLEAFKLDIEIPLKYGVDQCVGDTLCPGGIFYGQRGIPFVLDLCRDIRRAAQPDALFLNYGNPNAMLTWAALDCGGVRALGLCHGVQGGHEQIAKVLGARDPSEVDILAAGINHQTWYIRILYKGRLVSGEELLAAFERHPRFSQTEKVRIDVLRRFGYYSTESNGHLSEYLPWYRKRPKEIRRWIDLSSWINGETGGYLRECLEQRNWFGSHFKEWMSAPAARIGPGNRSAEHGSYIIEALETGRVYRGHFNVRNQGCISNLPEDCVVEVPCYVDRNGISVPRVGDLPLACAATCTASINVQRMAVKAAAAGDATLLKQALLHDPLTAAVCNPEEVWQMADRMLVAQARWLPQYGQAIGEARKRLRREKPLGKWKWKGAARLPVRSVAQLARAGKR